MRRVAGCGGARHSGAMKGDPHDLLSRFPLLATASLGEARQATSRFWPAHTSEVVGPEPYTLVMNRVLLGQLAITFIRCSARVRVVPSEPCEEACVAVPLSGSVEMANDGGTFRGTPGLPLFRGPGWVRRFEASPSECLMVDFPVAAVQAAATALGDGLADPLGPVSLTARQAERVRRQLLSLVQTISRNERVASIQLLAEADRQRLLSPDIDRREQALLKTIARAVAELPERYGGFAGPGGLAAVEAWLVQYALSGLSLAEIARRGGWTMRAIQRTCATAGTTPQAFLREVRLDRARELLSEPAAAVSVADVAVAVSLPHQGRFSAAYRERFGELPSDTLARTRRTAAGEGPGAGAGLDEADRARASVEEGCSPKRSRS